jgi:hypothetical protein
VGAAALQARAGHADLATTQRYIDLVGVAFRDEALIAEQRADTAAAKQVKGAVARRGLCGDVYLVSTPPGPRITDIKVETSVRRSELNLAIDLQGLPADNQFTLRATVTRDGNTIKEFTSNPFTAKDLANGRITLTQNWTDQLWDLHSAQNLYGLQVSLIDANGKTVDTSFPERFGFRGVTAGELAGSEPKESAQIVTEVLSGGGTSGGRASVVLNAGTAIYLSGLTPTYDEGVEAARAALTAGQGAAALERLRAASAA